MRTLKLNDEQITIIQNALGIAEASYSDIYKDICEKLIKVRGNDEHKEQLTIAQYYHKKSTEFADMNIAFQNAKFDI